MHAPGIDRAYVHSMAFACGPCIVKVHRRGPIIPKHTGLDVTLQSKRRLASVAGSDPSSFDAGEAAMQRQTYFHYWCQC